MKSFRLKLQIADMGGMGLTNEGVAIIHVSDINNHAPQFSPTSVSLRQHCLDISKYFKYMTENNFDTLILIFSSVFCVVPVVQYDSSGEQEGL